MPRRAPATSLVPPAVLAAAALALTVPGSSPSAAAPPAAGQPAPVRAANPRLAAGPVVQYGCISDSASWSGVAALYQRRAGVSVRADARGSALARLRDERARPVADCAYYAGPAGCKAALEGLHQAYKPRGWERIPPGLKDPGGRWWAVHTSVLALIVNTQALARAPVPRSWADLLKPAYRGKVAYEDPTWGGAGLTFAYGINEIMGGSGEDFGPGLAYLKALDANVVTYPRRSVYQEVLRGRIPIWIHADANGYRMKLADGGPVQVVIPAEGSFVLPSVMGMVAGAPHPRETREYLDWLIGAEAQGELARSFLRPVIPPAAPGAPAGRLLPASEYRRVRTLDLVRMAAASDSLKRAWLREIRRRPG